MFLYFINFLKWPTQSLLLAYLIYRRFRDKCIAAMALRNNNDDSCEMSSPVILRRFIAQHGGRPATS